MFWYLCRCCNTEFMVLDCRKGSPYHCPQCGEYGIHRLIKGDQDEKAIQNVETKQQA